MLKIVWHFCHDHGIVITTSDVITPRLFCRHAKVASTYCSIALLKCLNMLVWHDQCVSKVYFFQYWSTIIFSVLNWKFVDRFIEINKCACLLRSRPYWFRNKLGWSSKQRCKGQIRLLWDMSPFISGVKAALFVSIIPKSLKTTILTNLEQF